MLDFVKRILTGRKREVYSADELRVAFKDRYRQFRLLLKANNRVLDIMAEIEEALKGTQPFGMAYVRERCIRASANVHQIIERLNKLAPGNYEALHDRFEDILQKVYIKIINKVKKLKNPRAYVDWVTKVTENLCLDVIKKKEGDFTRSNR